MYQIEFSIQTEAKVREINAELRAAYEDNGVPVNFRLKSNHMPIFNAAIKKSEMQPFIKLCFNLDEKVDGERILLAIPNGHEINDYSLHQAAGKVLLSDLKLMDIDDDLLDKISSILEAGYYSLINIDALRPNIEEKHIASPTM